MFRWFSFSFFSFVRFAMMYSRLIERVNFNFYILFGVGKIFFLFFYKRLKEYLFIREISRREE